MKNVKIKHFTILVVSLCSLFIPVTGGHLFAAQSLQMRTKSATFARVAPSDKANKCASIATGKAISVAYTAGGWYGFSSPETGGKRCWLPVKDLDEVKTRGLPLLAVPLAIAAGEAIINWTADWFADETSGSAVKAVDSGGSVEILARKGRSRIGVRDDNLNNHRRYR